MEVRRTFIVIDSRDRNRMTHPNANDYVFILDDVIKNVSSVELVYAVYMKFDTETYVNLHIDEFAPNAIANNRILRDSFAQLPLINHMNEYTPNRFRSVKEFRNPISKLGRLTIKFYKHDGSLCDINEHLLRFEIKYYVYDGQVDTNDHLKNSLNLPPNFTKRMLNDEYYTKKNKCQDDEAREELKKQYVYYKGLLTANKNY